MADMPDDVYKKYSIRSEYTLFVTQAEKTSNLSIGYETWQLNFSGSTLTLSMHSSDSSKTVAELTFWYWKDKKEIVILQKTFHAFVAGSSNVFVYPGSIIPVNRKFNVLIRVLDERIATDNNSLESYFCHNEGLETITLCVAGTDNEETSFVVPKYVLMFTSPVFRRMFASEIKEKTPGKVDIQNTNPEDFGDFLKAISPKQENPNPSNVLSLLKLADCYDCQSLRDRCEAHLANCVEIPLVELLNSVKLYGLNNLKAKLMETFREIGLLDFVQQYKPMHDLVNELAEMIE